MVSSSPPASASAANLTLPQAAAEARPAERHTYTQILKSTALIGGSSVVTIGVRIVSAKAMALLLGPAGVGLIGLYSAILELTRSIAGMGVNSSGVRQIAAAVGSGELEQVARTAAVLRRTSLALGVVGGGVLVLLSRPVAVWTFGSEEFAAPVALLSLAVLFRSISDGQAALIQGMRRIGDLARIAGLSALIGIAVTVALVYVFREAGVVPSLVSGALITLVISWRFRRRIRLPQTPVTAVQAREEAGPLLKLGFAFMASAVLTTGAAYAVRIIVRDNLGLEAAGLYQAAWAVGGVYIAFILQAMGSDFYPRLTAVASNKDECNRLVNEQAQIGMLLAVPGVIATLTFAPLVIALLYHSTFDGAVEPLRWICLGMAVRVVAWPLGYIILAKGARRTFFWTEVAATLVHVGLALLLVEPFGLVGATMAFFGLYIVYGAMVYGIARRLIDFRWSQANRRTGIILLPVIGMVFVSFALLPNWVATATGALAVLGSGIYSVRTITTLVPLERAPSFVQVLVKSCRLASSPPPSARGRDRAEDG